MSKEKVRDEGRGLRNEGGRIREEQGGGIRVEGGRVSDEEGEEREQWGRMRDCIQGRRGYG